MNKTLLPFYTIATIISIALFLYNVDLSFKDRVNRPLNIKYLVICISSVFLLYSLYKTNKYVDEYILPILLFINVGSLLFISFHNNKLTNIHIISIIGIVYLLITFNYKDFKIKNGTLVKPNKSWIYQYIIILGLWSLSSSYLTKKSKIICSLLIVYPLLFPLDEYFIHRIVSLVSVYFVLNFP